MWGAYFGIILILEKLFLIKFLNKIPKFFSHLWAIFLFVYGWVIFALVDVGDIWLYTRALFGTNSAFDRQAIYLALNFIPLIIISLVASTPLFSKLYKTLEEKAPRLSAVFTPILIVLGFVLSLIFISASSYNPFLYFRF